MTTVQGACLSRALLSKCMPGEMVQNVLDCTECLRGFPQATYPMHGTPPQFLVVISVIPLEGSFLTCISYQISAYDHVANLNIFDAD
jgi:hypothetical protein